MHMWLGNDCTCIVTSVYNNVSNSPVQYAIDDSLPFIMNILLAQTFGLLGTIAVTSYGLPWFTVMLVPLGVLYYYIQRFYRRTSRSVAASLLAMLYFYLYASLPHALYICL